MLLFFSLLETFLKNSASDAFCELLIVPIFLTLPISEEGINGAFNGDHVLVRLNRERDARGPSGVISQILERSYAQLVGSISEHDGLFYFVPLRRDLPGMLKLEAGDTSLRSGEWVQCDLDYTHAEPIAVLKKSLGKTGSVSGDLKAICAEYGLPKKYTSVAERKAGAVTPIEAKRHDCRDLDIFTIDPVDAKDFDDGISYNEQGSVAEVGVHIADVACYVTPGSNLDKEALSRGFTSYLPGQTVGMLPSALSEELCSLQEGEERLAHSVFLTIDLKTGQVRKSRRIHTLIRSRHRLNFDQVERVLDGEESTGVDAQLRETLKKVAALTRKMRQWRAENEQFLPFETTEYRVLCSGKPLKLMGIQQVQAGVASNLIEELMLAANSAVAQELHQRKIPGFYRIHPEPSAESLDELAGMARTILRHERKLSLGNRGRLISFLKRMQAEESSELMTLSMIRCMSRAEYSLKPELHFGLGKELYSHFTSPIRRYPDLVVHQQLLAKDRGEATLNNDVMLQYLQQINELEYNNDQASFAVSDRLKMKLIQQEMGEHRGWSLECLVAKASAAGLQLYLRKYGLMGYMEINALGGKWRYDHKNLTLENLNRHTRYRVGDVIYASPLRMDTIRGNLLLKPAEFAF